MYIEYTLFGILNGLGRQGILLRNNIIISIIDITLLYILIGIPSINIYGFAINFVISPLTGCILNTIEIRKVTNIRISIGEILAFPAIIAAIEIIALKNLKSIVGVMFNSQNVATTALIFIGIIIYTILYRVLSPFIPKQN